MLPVRTPLSVMEREPFQLDVLHKLRVLQEFRCAVAVKLVVRGVLSDAGSILKQKSQDVLQGTELLLQALFIKLESIKSERWVISTAKALFCAL